MRDSLSHGLADFAARNRRPPCLVHVVKVHGCAPVSFGPPPIGGPKKSPQVVWVPPAASIEIWLARLLACQCLRGGSRRPKSMCICTIYIHGRKREGATFYRARNGTRSALKGTRHARRKCNLHTFFNAHVMFSEVRSTGTRPITGKVYSFFPGKGKHFLPVFQHPMHHYPRPLPALCILLNSVVGFNLDGSGDSSAACNPPRSACTYLCAKSCSVHFWPWLQPTPVQLNLSPVAS